MIFKLHWWTWPYLIAVSYVYIKFFNSQKSFFSFKCTTHNKIVVGYTGAKKGSCFKFLRVPAYLMQYNLLSILTPFLLKSAKKWDSAVQKTKSEEGGLWGVLKMAIRTKYLILHHTVLVLVLSCIFLRSKNPFVKVLRKSDHPYS